jgi:hypothetical protein
MNTSDLVAFMKAKHNSIGLDDEDVLRLISEVEDLGAALQAGTQAAADEAEEVEQLTAEIERERQQRDYISLVAQRDIKRLQERLAEEDAAEAVAERRLELLRRLQWACLDDWPPNAPSVQRCPDCKFRQDQGHSLDCELAAELNPPGAPPRPADAAPSSGP